MSWNFLNVPFLGPVLIDIFTDQITTQILTKMAQYCLLSKFIFLIIYELHVCNEAKFVRLISLQIHPQNHSIQPYGCHQRIVWSFLRFHILCVWIVNDSAMTLQMWRLTSVYRVCLHVCDKYNFWSLTFSTFPSITVSTLVTVLNSQYLAMSEVINSSTISPPQYNTCNIL